MGLYKRNAKYIHNQLEWTKTGDVEDNQFKPIVDRIINSKQSIVIMSRGTPVCPPGREMGVG